MLKAFAFARLWMVRVRSSFWSMTVLFILIGGAEVVDSEYECDHTAVLDQSQTEIKEPAVSDMESFYYASGGMSQKSCDEH